MVSVEAAIATGSLVAVLVLVLAAMSAVILQLRCVDAAGEAARLASRGDSDAARRAAARLVPVGVGITVETHGEDVVARVDAAPLGSAIPGLRVGGSSTAAREPDVSASGEPGSDAGSSPVGVPAARPPFDGASAAGSPPVDAPTADPPTDPSGRPTTAPVTTPLGAPTTEPLPVRRPP